MPIILTNAALLSYDWDSAELTQYKFCNNADVFIIVMLMTLHYI